MRAVVHKLEINKLVNVPTSLINFLKKVDDLDVGKLKTAPIDLEKLSYVLSKEVVKKTVYNKLNVKVSNLEKKVPDMTTLFHSNQYNTDKQTLEKIGEVENKLPDTSDLVTTFVLNTEIGNVENKMPNVSGLVKKVDCNTKISDIKGTTSNHNKFAKEILDA